MKKFLELVKQHGLGLIIYAVSMDSYRRQVWNDHRSKILEQINEEKSKMEEAERREYVRLIEEQANNVKNKATLGRCREAAEEYKKAEAKYNQDPSDFNKSQKDKSFEKMNEAFDEIEKLDIGEYLVTLYNKYSDYLDSLGPDKIVCLTNITIDGLILSSFVTVLNIMLSENIINKLTFLEKYPRILKLIQIRNNINKKVIKLYLIVHLILVLTSLLGNLYMFFL